MAYNADTEVELLNTSPEFRVNQVSLSQDGRYLAVCFGKTLEIYCLNSSASSYAKIISITDISYNINSCVISRDGSTVVASGISYASTNSKQFNSTAESDTTKGKVFSYSITGMSVTALGSCELSTGSMRVAIVDSGYFWAASLHDGSCVMFKQVKPDSVEWQFKPNNPLLELAYAIDITQTDSGEVYVACGANLKVNTVNGVSSAGGFLYLIKSVLMVYDEESQYPEPYYKGILQWSTDIQYGVNPGVSLDKNANYVTATDGKPDGQTVKESAGSFYLYSVSTGSQIWKQDTSQMNWPMMLAQDGSSVFGGSDEGSVYYWNLSSD
jgi:WD40 repeat protein